MRRNSKICFSSVSAFVVVAIAACTSTPETYPASAPAGPCAAVTQQHAIEGSSHVDVCSGVSYGTKPPSSGNHYPVWAAYRSYSAPIPEGFWVHDLEHGAIVLTYDCPGAGCAADVDAAQKMIDAFADDPSCAAPVRHRFVMTPDPKLDVKFAASAWGWTLRADCFDPVAFGDFAKAHYAGAPENLCGDGQDLSTGVSPGCGQ